MEEKETNFHLTKQNPPPPQRKPRKDCSGKGVQKQKEQSKGGTELDLAWGMTNNDLASKKGNPGVYILRKVITNTTQVCSIQQLTHGVKQGQEAKLNRIQKHRIYKRH